jgi:hypothetical protein
MNFAREHSRRGTRNDEFGTLGIHDAAHKALPSANELDFIHEPQHTLATAQRRVPSVEFLQQESELLHPNANQPVIIEAQVERLRGGVLRPPLRKQLAEKSGFAGPAHPDDCMRFAGNLREAGVAWSEGRLCDGAERGIQPLFKHWM